MNQQVTPTQADLLNKFSNVTAVLLPVLTAATAAFGLASGDLTRAYREDLTASLTALFLIGFALACAGFAAAIKATGGKSSFWNATFSVLTIVSFVAGTVTLIAAAADSESGHSAPVIKASYSSATGLTLTVTSARLSGTDSILLTAQQVGGQGDPNKYPCGRSLLFQTLVGQDTDGNVNYSVDLPPSLVPPTTDLFVTAADYASPTPSRRLGPDDLKGRDKHTVLWLPLPGPSDAPKDEGVCLPPGR